MTPSFLVRRSREPCDDPALYEVRTSRRENPGDLQRLRAAVERHARSQDARVCAVQVMVHEGCIELSIDIPDDDRGCVRDAERVLELLWYDAFGEPVAPHAGEIH